MRPEADRTSRAPRAVLITALVTGLLAPVAGCAGPAVHPAPPSPGAGPGATAVAAGQLKISGAVRRPATLTLGQLAAMPSRTVTVSFGTEHGTQRHTEKGVALMPLLERAGLVPPGRKHGELSIGVLAVGSDGYRALLSYGELAPGLGNAGALLATAQDGAPLLAPRLVLPRDGQGARYVSGVVELDVRVVG